MSPHAAFMFGLSVGLLLAALVALGHLIRYVSSDLEHYTRYLDLDAGAATLDD